jgi:hypothetical protein
MAKSGGEVLQQERLSNTASAVQHDKSWDTCETVGAPRLQFSQFP